MLRLLVSGAGGPSAVSFMRAVQGPGIECHAGDMDRFAAGLYLVPEERRVLLPPGAHPEFVDETVDYCARHAIDAFIPTVDWELLPAARARERFADVGTRVMVAEPSCLEVALDKLALLTACSGICDVPRSAVFDDRFDVTRAAEAWGLPLVVKPRRGAGGRGVHVLSSLGAIASAARDPSLLVQEHLPGAEYSVDVLSGADAEVLAVVPRLRLKVDSGIAVAGRTLHHDGLDAAARAVARHLGLTFVSNLQFREDALGTPRLMEVNVRFPGTMPLTIASGVDMPRLALAVLFGRPVPPNVGRFRDVAMVRTWQDHLLPADAFERLDRQPLVVAG
jgi:carbamoyl-phosphate synthase large subunit